MFVHEFDHSHWEAMFDAVTTPKVEVDKPDHRLLPTKYGEGNVCRCSAHIDTNDHEQIGCKWYSPSKYRLNGMVSLCMYDRFGIMCDKVLNKDGEGIN